MIIIIIISDNAKNFKSSSKQIVKIARSNKVIRILGDRRVTWKFIVERAPWWGGFWERLIRSVKRSLRKSIGRSNLTYEQTKHFDHRNGGSNKLPPLDIHS